MVSGATKNGTLPRSRCVAAGREPEEYFRDLLRWVLCQENGRKGQGSGAKRMIGGVLSPPLVSGSGVTPQRLRAQGIDARAHASLSDPFSPSPLLSASADCGGRLGGYSPARPDFAKKSMPSGWARAAPPGGWGVTRPAGRFPPGAPAAGDPNYPGRSVAPPDYEEPPVILSGRTGSRQITHGWGVRKPGRPYRPPETTPWPTPKRSVGSLLLEVVPLMLAWSVARVVVEKVQR